MPTSTRNAVLDAGERNVYWQDLDKKLMEEIVPWVPIATNRDVISEAVVGYEYDQFSGEMAWAQVGVDQVEARLGGKVEPREPPSSRGRLSGLRIRSRRPAKARKRRFGMGRYVIRRLLWVVLVILVVTLITFTIFYVMPPGNPAVRSGRQAADAGADCPGRAATRADRLFLAWPPWESRCAASFLDRLFTGDTADDCPSTIQGCGWPGLGVSYDSF